MFNPKISLYERVKISDGNFSQSVERVLEEFKSGHWADPVQEIRKLAESRGRDAVEVKEKKVATLPIVTFAGRFHRRANEALIKHSGFVALDFDSVGDSASFVQALTACKLVAALWRSCTGTGVWILVKVTPVPANNTQHRAAFDGVVVALENETGKTLDDHGLDRGAKDLARACFVSFDPALHINEDALAVEWQLAKSRPCGETVGDGTSALSKEAIRHLLSAIPPKPDYEPWVRIIAAVGACVGESITSDDAVELLKEWSPEEKPGEYEDKLRHRLDKVGVGTLVRLARDAGWRGDLRPALQWSQPLPLPPEHPDAEPFSSDLLPESLARFVKDVADRMQCPPDYVAVGLMVAAGAVLGRKVGLRPKRLDDWLELANLWGVVVGPPSVLKTPALAEAMSAVNLLAAEAHDRFLQQHAEFEITSMVQAAGKDLKKERIKKALKSGHDAVQVAREEFEAVQTEPKCRRYVVNDTTMEKLAELLCENPNGLLVFRDELAGWLRSLDREDRANDRAFALECWTGKGSYTQDRIGRGTIRIPAAILSVLGTIQPGVLGEYVAESVRGGSGNDGLVQRFGLLVWPQLICVFKNVDRFPDREAKEAVVEIFRRLDSLTAESVGAATEDGGIPFLRFTDSAQDIFDAWRETFENRLRTSDEHPALIAHFAKYRKLVPALALIIFLASGGTGSIGSKSINQAIAWQRYLESHARKIYSAVTRLDFRAARQIARHIRIGDLANGFSLRDVYRPGWSGLADAKTAMAGVDLLIRLGWLREVEQRTAGRPSTSYEINPGVARTTDVGTDKTDETTFVSSGSEGEPNLEANAAAGESLQPLEKGGDSPWTVEL